MNRKIKEYIKLVFEDIPYSPETSEAQKKIERALGEKYDELCAERSEGEAFDLLIAEYGQLARMAMLAGYSEDQVAAWRSGGDVVDPKSVKKTFRKQRWRAYAAAFFTMAAFVELLWAIFDLIDYTPSFFFALAMLAVCVFLVIFFIGKICKTEREIKDRKYDNEAYEYIRSCSDRYTKRFFNSIALLISAIFVFIGAEMSFFIFGNSKSAELAEKILLNIIVVEIPIFLFVKNLLLHLVTMRRIDLPDKKKSRIYGIVVCSASFVFWIGISLFAILAREKLTYPGNVFLIAAVVFAVIFVITNLTIRKKITFRNVVLNRKRVAFVMVIVILATGFTLLQRDTWYTQSYINSIPVVEHNSHKIDYDEETGVYTITASTGDFKILHLTDIHLGGSLFSYRKDLKALQACYAEIEYTRPDLVLVTGDMCFPMGIMSLSLNNSAPVQQFAAFMRNIGIPWAFTYGNHDTEVISTLNTSELNEVYKKLSFKTSGNLLYPYVQPDITGRNNQVIVLRNSDGSINTALFMIDSNAYTGKGLNDYDYIHDDQVEWYEDEVRRLNAEAGHTINSLLFFHIPLQEYKTATELYLAGSDEVKWYFGENPGDHGGITNDLVCCSDYPSKLFDTAVRLGSTTGLFCGHDHYNNASLEYKGIRLTYGMSIDYLAMPGIENETKQRGAEMITIRADGRWDLVQIPLDSITK